MTEPFNASILIVEDDPQQLKLYSQALTGYRLTCVTNGSAALAVLEKEMPDLILLDHVLEGGELGAQFLPRLKQTAAHVPVIVISGTLGLEQQLETLQGPHAAHYVLKKPVHLQKLRETVKLALDECGFGEMVRSMRSLERAECLATSERERLFTERLARQYELLKRLRGATHKPNISDLAGEFHVDRRTIRRDLHDLVTRRQLPPVVIEGEPAE
jgi:two-component system, cell cycle response regulator DivK